MERWYRIEELDPKTKIVLSFLGYTNDEISLAWIKHFHQYAKTFSGKRLLILDGHESHHTIEIIEFCNDYDTIPFAMPLHLIHFLQYLNVVVFQPLKLYQQRH